MKHNIPAFLIYISTTGRINLRPDETVAIGFKRDKMFLISPSIDDYRRFFLMFWHSNYLVKIDESQDWRKVSICWLIKRVGPCSPALCCNVSKISRAFGAGYTLWRGNLAADLPYEIFLRNFKGWLSKEESWYDPSFSEGGMSIIRGSEFGRPRCSSLLRAEWELARLLCVKCYLSTECRTINNVKRGYQPRRDNR